MAAAVAGVIVGLAVGVLLVPGARNGLEGGLRVAFVGLQAEENETVVSVRILGREGLEVFPTADIVLTDAAGTALRITSFTRALDNDERNTSREQTWLFPPLSPTAGTLSLVVDTLLVESESAPLPNPVNGPWTIHFPFDGHVPRSLVLDLPGEGLAAPFSPGVLVVERITQTARSTIIEGHVDGFLPEDMDKFGFHAVLVRADEEIRATSGHGGYGERRERFQFEFPLAVGHVSLRVVARPGLGADGSGWAGRLAGLADAKAEISLELTSPRSSQPSAE